MVALACFKAYDVRGRLGEELNDDIAYRIGLAYAQQFGAKHVAVGCDVRASSATLKQALTRGLLDSGADVTDIGVTGTEEIYFAAFHLDVDGGIEITASHNPIDFNGMKFVGRGATPISLETGLGDMQRLVEQNAFTPAPKRGRRVERTLLAPYVDHLLSYVDVASLRPLRLLVNSGNGAAGHVVDALEQRFAAGGVPIEFVKLFHQPDSTFPNGIPNPLLAENRAVTAEAVLSNKADMGIAWDGDFDRCFLFDGQGRCVEGYYIVGLLAEAFLRQAPGEKIIHDPRLTWNTIDIVRGNGGVPIMSKTGHAYIKRRMREENAVYGGEMSSHHYFRDFGYCDSGMIPWLLVAELMGVTGKTLAELVEDRIGIFPCSGEINYAVPDPRRAIACVTRHFLEIEPRPELDETDGVSFEFPDWRMNLRMSNTESLLRLNVEARGDSELVGRQVAEIARIIGAGSCL